MYVSTDPFLIVGAGLAGLVAARELHTLGYKVIVLEKSGDDGGRMATRAFAEARFDSGEHFYTVSDPQYVRMVDQWTAPGEAVLRSIGYTGP